MFLEEVNEVKECIDLSNNSFYYYKDKYAVQLMKYAVGCTQKVHEIKKSKWGFLLNKSPLKSILANIKGKELKGEDLQSYWPENHQTFKLSYDHWGEFTKHRHATWRQTSRPGYNLVLQLNFTFQEINNYKKYITPKCDYEDWNPFHSYGHPATQLTMAWARLDMSFETGELLIEEIQNDYLREVIAIYKRLQKLDAIKQKKERERHLDNHWIFRTGGGDFTSYTKYYESLLPFFKIWDEAMLSAVIWFAKEELGIDKVYYHTEDSGRVMKRFRKEYTMPPKSLYTKLPRRFGFELIDEAPQFLENEDYLKRIFKKNNKLKWFVMQL